MIANLIPLIVKATDENLTSENWELIMVGSLGLAGKRYEGWG